MENNIKIRKMKCWWTSENIVNKKLRKNYTKKFAERYSKTYNIYYTSMQEYYFLKRRSEKIFFKEDKHIFKIMAQNERYKICVRKLNRRTDADLLWNEVGMWAFTSFTNAYNFLRKHPIYTIVDIEEQIRWSDNYVFWDINYFKKSDCIKLLNRLIKWECEISHRNRIILNIINP